MYKEINLTEREQFLKLIEDDELLFNQTPLLRIDGMKLVQSGSIIRYLADRGGLTGKDAKQRARVDIVAEGARDFWTAAFGRAGFADTISNVIEKAKTEVLPKYLPKFEKILTENGSDYLVGSTLTYADLQLYEVLIAAEEYQGQESFATYPKIRNWYNHISSDTRIQYYKEKIRKPPIDQTYIDTVNIVLGRK